MLLTITPLYAGLLGLLYLTLTIRVVRGRIGKGAPSLGDGGNHQMFRAIRGHANFSEYVPLILLMMAMLEVGGVYSPWVLHALGITLLVARIGHGIALSYTDNWVLGRAGGALLTFLVLAIVSVLCVWRGIAVMTL
ncbi:MAG: hypothetical protein JWQ90_5504 [Hydrocarboniphaga sp.]|uniref:MAPEG family protein n=1 Tax=Hydrocarboniphaga sp. TaxID=2033016 RepID=UPI00262FCF35|nr:MAPEG family protein [Hydrocarboniphaga sp.]MDB5973054.1 hypothetical protein [Hydrocarboniphaga sp.]